MPIPCPNLVPKGLEKEGGMERIKKEKRMRVRIWNFIMIHPSSQSNAIGISSYSIPF
jgi:hypothetical protein